MKISFRILSFLLFFSSQAILGGGFAAGTLVKTPGGYTPIENLVVGDLIYAHDFQQGAVLQPVRLIHTLKIDCAVYLSVEDENLCMHYKQLVYVPRCKSWLPAFALCDDQGSSQLNRNSVHSGLSGQKKENQCVELYELTLPEVHQFYVTRKDLIVHNFFPAFAIGLSWTFGVAGIEFSGVMFSIAAAGLAIGANIALKKSVNGTREIELDGIIAEFQGSSPNKERKNDQELDSERDNKGPENNHDGRIVNTVSKTEFFRKIKDRYERYKKELYRLKKGAEPITKDAHYLQWDHTHNDVEAWNKRKIHIGSIDPQSCQIYKKAVGHTIKKG